MGQLLLYEAPVGLLTKWGPGKNSPVAPLPVGEAGHKRVLDIFSHQKFVNNFDELVQHLSTSSGEDD